MVIYNFYYLNFNFEFIVIYHINILNIKNKFIHLDYDWHIHISYNNTDT